VTTFQQWLIDYLAIQGIEPDDPANLDGFAFESEDGLGLSISACAVEDRAMVMVPVTVLDPGMAEFGAVLLALHERNEDARWRDDWLVTLDPNDVLVLSSVRSLSAVRPHAVDAWISDGIEQREELRGWLMVRGAA